MDKMRMDRVSCHVTAKCNLRCRMCAVYIPRLYELGNVPEYDIADIKESFRCYFELVSHVRLVSLTGGEPMLYPHLAELLEELLSYEEAYDKLEVFTNGSLDVPDPVFSALAKSGKMMLFIDHYGPEVSRKAEKVAEECEKRHIRYTLREYYGPNAHMGGWVNRAILSNRLSAEKAREHSEKCVVGRPGGRLFTIFGKDLAFCATPYCGRRIGAVPPEDVLTVPLGDRGKTLEEKREGLLAMCRVEYNPGCAWCNGLGIYENTERYVPGEQVKQDG